MLLLKEKNILSQFRVMVNFLLHSSPEDKKKLPVILKAEMSLISIWVVYVCVCGGVGVGGLQHTSPNLALTTLAKYVEDEVVKNFLRHMDYFFPSNMTYQG